MSITAQFSISQLAMIGISGGELVLIAVVLLVLLGVLRPKMFIRGFKLGIDELRSPIGGKQREPADLSSSPRIEIPYPERTDLDPIVWLAQGFGTGSLKPGPGTWGSVIGLIWFAALLVPGSLWMFFGGILLSVPVSVAACGIAEKVLGQKDPGSVVLDEIIAVPLCFSAWVLAVTNDTSKMPTVAHFFSSNRLFGVVAVFAAFRLFDVWKPWPVHQSQSLPGGWGVTVDDLLAAVYVNLVILPFLIGR
ncbi:MAG: phosphatidylglycerophosphatase A [Verrucomicrobia bacterium]|nr:phosphatidylglycerophosphatase A [Verrucomicrobiota bacterium]